MSEREEDYDSDAPEEFSNQQVFLKKSYIYIVIESLQEKKKRVSKFLFYKRIVWIAGNKAR